MRLIFLLILLIPSVAMATCTTTVGKVPVTTTGSPTPVICDGDITDTGGNIGIGTSLPGTTLDVRGTVQLSSGTTGAVLCLTTSKQIGHCSSTASCSSTCTCTCTVN